MRINVGVVWEKLDMTLPGYDTDEWIGLFLFPEYKGAVQVVLVEIGKLVS